MKALHIAWKDTSLRLRDPMALVISLVSPLVILFILGVVFGGNRSLEPTTTIIVDRDGGQLGRVYVAALLSDQVKTYIKATQVADEAAARAAVAAGQVATAVIIPPGFTDAVFKGEKQTVEVYIDPTQTIGPAVVRSIVESLTLAIVKNSATVRVTLTLLAESGRVSAADMNGLGAQLGRQLQAELAAAGNAPSGIALSLEGVRTRPDNGAMAYFAPAMLVLFLMFNAVRSGTSLLEEKDDGTLSRLFVAPVSRTTVLAGKLIGNLLQTGLQACILTIGLSLLFHVNLGDPLATVLLLLGLVVTVIALGLVLAGLVKSPSVLDGASSAVVLLMALIGGAFTRSDNSVINTISLITPNHWALDGFVRLTNGGHVADVWPNLLVLVAMSTVLALIGKRLLNQKLAVA